MAKLKATPKNFEQALAVLGNRDSVRLGNNTFLERGRSYIAEQSGPLSIRLLNTEIVKFYPDGRVTLHTGGWRIVTTKDRINEFISGRVYQKNRRWFYVGHTPEGALDWEHPQEFAEGMEAA